ncbi:sensor histidine kinase [Tunicatimonas pelagia]|uniref:sensor histidine kinase n=1 Tax=Tunicatimonas pelagia TaxID=931531 RepID=UPI0026664680|nr:histidine kinase [Tunicatimonas pelagia]WKN45645.1 histidine kinase [Tunicatimonas pelagia]
MHFLKETYQRVDTPFLRHLLFWIVIFVFHIITSSRVIYNNVSHSIGVMAVMTALQVIVAYVTLYILMPKLLDKKRFVLFGGLLALLLVLATTGYYAAKYYYFEPMYPQSYAWQFEKFGYFSVPERLANLSVTASKAIFFFSPTVLLLLFQFYRNQQRLAKINEQKKTAELTALKHQLNPHFLFNTLNNVYALAVKKSDKTPEVISKLSDMLDYMLYRCNEDYVPLAKEVALIENYLTLEKIRYGQRVAITFDNSLHYDLKIAPLLLLTFVENAFKHGVSQEINQATIAIGLSTQAKTISFRIRNSVPAGIPPGKAIKPAIGLRNVRKQLALLYPNAHQLQIEQTTETYCVTLNLQAP